MESKAKFTRHWQVAVLALLGLWFAASPWVLGAADDNRVLAVNVLLGLALAAAAAVMTSASRAAAGAWSAVVLGLVAAVSPWLLGRGDDINLAANAIATGVVAAILGTMVGFMVGGRDGWWNDRIAH